jgi:hypothetical protein
LRVENGRKGAEKGELRVENWGCGDLKWASDVVGYGCDVIRCGCDVVRWARDVKRYGCDVVRCPCDVVRW